MSDIVIRIRGEGSNLEVLDSVGRQLDAFSLSADRSSGALQRFLGGYGGSEGGLSAVGARGESSTATAVAGGLKQAAAVHVQTAQSEAVIVHDAASSYAAKMQKAGDTISEAATKA